MVLYQHNENAKSQNLPISNNLFSQIQKDILQGKMRSGEKLTEQSICDKYAVSRTPVREALRQLEMEGLIETIPNRGAFIIGFSAQDMADMYELRKTYEIQAVKWAIERITDEEMEDLRETFEFMEFYTQKNDIDKMLNINTGFHQLIYTASHNRMLQHVLSSYQIYIKYSRKPGPYPDNYLPDVLEEHREIFNAFENKDIQAGAAAMTKHMESSMARAKKTTLSMRP